MSVFSWNETTSEWVGKTNPHRRHDAFDEATQTHLVIERERKGEAADHWAWVVYVPHQTGHFWLPGGDLPDDEAKLRAPAHLAGQVRKLLGALS